jgi:hypothetical protein
MNFTGILLKRNSYNNVFIIQDRNWWERCKNDFNIENDLLLTIDFGLKNEVEKAGGNVEYLDHFIETEYLEKLNYKLLDFLWNWDKAADPETFKYKGIYFGDSFLINILNDICYTTHFFTFIQAIKLLKTSKIFCGIEDICIKQLVTEIHDNVVLIPNPDNRTYPSYFFPINKWLYEKLEYRSLKNLLWDLTYTIMDKIVYIKNIFHNSENKLIYISRYHPTQKIIEHFIDDNRFHLLTNYYSSRRRFYKENRVSFISNKKHKSADKYLMSFKQCKQMSFNVEGFDLTSKLYDIIESNYAKDISKCLVVIDRILNYFKNKDLKLMIPICDYFIENRLLMNYCFKNDIPIFMIINGLLVNNFENECRGPYWVNAYGQILKEDYFYNATNVFCLGDPRMDNYFNHPEKSINRIVPTIVIGAAGYAHLDFNAYLSFEFDFLNDILKCLEKITELGYQHKVIIKVRGNGYSDQYNAFVAEYFPKMDIQIVQSVPFIEVINMADFYITFYSQTVFEASCLGIPALYYKKDTQIINRPFDTKTELVTAINPDDLTEKILSFYNNDPIYNDFLKKDVLEKYIGQLDGHNTDRNLDFIYSIIK